MMHDLLRDIGREIVREKSPSIRGKRSRLWDPEDVTDVLMTNSVSTFTIKLDKMHVRNKRELYMHPHLINCKPEMYQQTLSCRLNEKRNKAEKGKCKRETD